MRLRHVLMLILLLMVAHSCASSRQLRDLGERNVAARLQTVSDDDASAAHAAAVRRIVSDTVPGASFDGRQMFLMNAVRDESGDMVASDVIDAAYVSARFRNVAERHGRVDLEFQIIVPREMYNSRWQMRFAPGMYILGDTVNLDRVLVTGADYRKAQLRGYQQYERFLRSIVTDTTRFIDMFDLELFLQRNLPLVYRFRNDSTFVSDEEFMSHYGVTEKDAVEHYTYLLWKRYNERRAAKSGRMFARFVKSPLVTEGIRLDTVMRSPSGDWIYNYVQTIATRPNLRKVEISLGGEIYESGERIYSMMRSEPLTFYISSLSSLADSTERFLTRIVERRVDLKTSAELVFALGRSDIDISLGGNLGEMDRIRDMVSKLMEEDEYVLDSVVVQSTCSPDGSYELNRRLSKSRSASVSSMLRGDGIPFVAHTLPEDWETLGRLVENDSLLTDVQKQEYRSSLGHSSADADEAALRGKGWFPHLRDDIYPLLRRTHFTFSMHRKGMVRDTIHTTVPDTIYRSGVMALREHDYKRAATLLGSYRDFNAALALVAADRNESALDVLRHLEQGSEVNYLLAIVNARLGNESEALFHYMEACRQNPRLVHRGNLDPEIFQLINKPK